MRIFFQVALFLFCVQRVFAEGISFPVQTGEKGEVKAGYLSLPKEHPIDNSTYLYVHCALAFFVKEKVSFVLLDLDTPGGEVFAALRIAQELRKIEGEQHIPVIALVDDWALSAGALLAYSCRYIGTTSQGSMGAAEPVVVGSDGTMNPASEKMISALRVEFAKAAEFYNRNPQVAESMVDKDFVLVKRKGEILRLLEDSQIEQEDEVIITKGKLLTLDAKQMQSLGVSNFILTAKSYDPLSGQILIKEEPFFSFPIQWLSYENWKISFFAFLSHPIVSSLLLFGFLFGLYSTLQSQMLGGATLVAVCCLIGMLIPNFALALMGWLEILFLVLGLGLLFIDLLAIGSWFLGGVGVVVTLGALLAILLPSLEGVSFSWDPKEWGIVLTEWIYRLSVFLCAVFISLVVCGLCSRFFLRRSFFARRLVLEESKITEVIEPVLPIEGASGVSVSALRPWGQVEIAGIVYEAETEGEFIAAGVSIIVIKTWKNRLKVREEKK